MLAEAFDEGRLARAGRAGNADTQRMARKWQQFRQQHFGAFTIAHACRFNERNGAREGLAIAGTNSRKQEVF
jgi:hypothetical protein